MWGKVTAWCLTSSVTCRWKQLSWTVRCIMFLFCNVRQPKVPTPLDVIVSSSFLLELSPHRVLTVGSLTPPPARNEFMFSAEEGLSLPWVHVCALNINLGPDCNITMKGISCHPCFNEDGFLHVNNCPQKQVMRYDMIFTKLEITFVEPTVNTQGVFGFRVCIRCSSLGRAFVVKRCHMQVWRVKMPSWWLFKRWGENWVCATGTVGLVWSRCSRCGAKAKRRT